MKWIEWIFWWEPFYVVVLGIPLLFPERFVPLRFHLAFVSAILLFGFIRWIGAISKAYHTEQGILAIPCLCLIISLYVGISISHEQAVSIVAAGYLAFGIALYSAISVWLPFLEKPSLFAKIYLATIALFSFVAPVFVLWKPEFRLFELPLYALLGTGGLNEFRFFDETIHANVLAGALVPSLLILAPLCVYLPMHGATKSRPLTNIGTTAVLWLIAMYWLLLIMLTQSRGAYLGILVGFCLITILYRPKLLSFFIALTVTGVGWLIWLLYSRLSSFLGMENTLGGGEFRWDVWSAAASAIRDAPLTGIGPGMYSIIVPVLYPFAYVDGRLAEHAHNLFLQIGLDLGVLGLIAYLSIVIVCLYMLLQILRRATSPYVWALAVGATSAIVGMSVHGIFDAVLWGTKVAFVPWLIFGLVTLLFFDQMKRTESQGV